jgi:hypothetical protein
VRLQAETGKIMKIDETRTKVAIFALQANDFRTGSAVNSSTARFQAVFDASHPPSV